MIPPASRVMLGVTDAMTFLASVILLLRFLAQRQSSVQWDNWICAVSLVVAYSFLTATGILAAASCSLHMVSILLVYRRIFVIKPAFRKATWVVGCLVFSFFVPTTCSLIFLLNPVKAEWKPWIPRTSTTRPSGCRLVAPT